jgi:hypothetical protein
MERAATGKAAGGQDALSAECTTDYGTLSRVSAALRAGLAGVDPLPRHDHLELAAGSMERRTMTLLRHRDGAL